MGCVGRGNRGAGLSGEALWDDDESGAWTGGARSVIRGN